MTDGVEKCSARNDFDGHVPVKMALAQFTFEWFRGGVAALGAVHGRCAVYHGRVADTCTQVHTELVQRLPEQSVRGPTLRDSDGWNAVCGAAFGDLHKGAENSCGVYV